jgi:hypothetical protein
MAMDIEVIWVRREAEYFCKRDWTTQIGLIRLNKFEFTRKAERPVQACFQRGGFVLRDAAETPSVRMRFVFRPRDEERGNAVRLEPLNVTASQSGAVLQYRLQICS